MQTAQREVRTLDAGARRACGSRATRFDSLHNKHGYARGKHRHCGDRHDDPSKRKLGWPCISFLSEATTRIATRSASTGTVQFLTILIMERRVFKSWSKSRTHESSASRRAPKKSHLHRG